jgi:type I restriction enzyme S subunit
MGSNYKPIGNYIQLVDERNKGLKVGTLLGLSISKQFIKSVANTIGTDMENYKIIRKNQFACSTMQVRRDKKMPVALYSEDKPSIISQAYPIFEIINANELLPEYLMMWFTRSEFDREACFHAVGGVRGSLEWEDFCGMQLPIPSPEKQQEIIREYNIIQNRIALNNKLITKLEETAQAIYKQWFVDFEFPDENGKPYRSNAGEMVWCEELEKEIPEGYSFSPLSNYIKINSGFAFKSDWWINSGLPVIKIGTIQNNSISEVELEFISELNIFKKENYRVNKGDIVLAMTGFTMGKIGLVPNYLTEFYVNQRVGFFKLGHSNYLKTGYLFCTLTSQQFQNEIWSFGGDSQQFNVSNDQVASIKIILPDTKSIIEKFNLITESFFERIINVQASNRMLLKLKDLLLSKMTKVETEKEIV